MFLNANNSFFIVGCQRSGTTLLRLVLDSHPEIRCFDELQSYRLLASKSSEQTIRESWVGLKIPRWTEQLDSPVQLDFGLIEKADHIYEGQKILFLVRDYRDTIASMLKLKDGSESWLAHWAKPTLDTIASMLKLKLKLKYGAESWLGRWAKPTLRWKVETEPGFATKWRRELELCRASRGSLVALGALYWSYKNEALLRYSERGHPVLGVSYEQLVREPETELRRICSFLDIDFSNELLDHSSKLHGEVFESGRTVGNTDPRRSIDTSSVGQWREFFGDKDAALAEAIVGKLPSSIAPLLARNLVGFGAPRR
ncbi:MAG: sulfotransferase [Bryobacteraceae bacterium]|jgi:protein-tyrosine sulfotransferase